MASLMENLIDVLDKLSSEYEGLLELSQKKAPIIVSGNLEKLQKITDEEQELVSRINHLDKKRVEVTADMANVLQSAVRDLQKVNEHNDELLKEALEMVTFEMNLIQAMKAAPETANYNKGAYSAGNTMGVVTRGFDAKQ